MKGHAWVLLRKKKGERREKKKMPEMVIMYWRNSQKRGGQGKGRGETRGGVRSKKTGRKRSLK